MEQIGGKQKFVKYSKILFLPLFLSIIFVIQNYFFNYWLDIFAKIYDNRLFASTFALGIILYYSCFFFNKKYRYIFLLAISLFISILFSAQFLYYRYSQSFLQFSAIKYIWQVNSVAGTAKTLITPELFLFFVNTILVVFVFIFYLKRKPVEIKIPWFEKFIILFVVVAVAALGYNYLVTQERKEWGNTSRLFTDVYDLKALVDKMGIINFSIEDTIKYALRSNLITEEDKIFLKNFGKNLQTAEEKSKYFGSAKGKNLIIIQVESLENSVINQTIGDKQITPNLNQLAQQGLYFSNFYAQIGPGNTADAEFSTMNSLYPLPDDVAFIDYAKNSYSALPQLLAKNGYSTNVMHGDVPTFWNRSNVYPSLGYQDLYELSDYTITRPIGKGPSALGDTDLFFQSLSKLTRLKTPFMTTFITMSSHTPFILPADLQGLQFSVDTSLSQTQQNYLQSIHYTDKAIGEFIQGLKDNNLYKDSLILIWGDHGSFTGITKALENPNNALPELADAQVPLIILNSGTNINGRISTPGSQLDIYPTISSLLGIVAPKTILGQDLLNTKTPVATRFSLVSGGIIAILTDKLAYESPKDGDFKLGKCVSIPKNNILPINECKNLYSQQANTIKASNIIIRGDLLSTYGASLERPQIKKP